MYIYYVSKTVLKFIDSFDDNIKTFFGLVFGDCQRRGQSYYITLSRFGQQAILH